MESKKIECNLIDDEDDKCDINVVLIPIQVIFRISDKKLNLKWKRKQKWQKEKYSRELKIKNKIATMIVNATKEYLTSEEDVRRVNETKKILNNDTKKKIDKEEIGTKSMVGSFNLILQ